MTFSPTYVWPNPAIPFRLLYSGPACRVFLIENIVHNYTWLQNFHDGIRDTDYFFVIIGSHFSSFNVKESARMLEHLSLPKEQFYILCNDDRELLLFREQKFSCHVVNQNAWLDENHIMKPMTIPKLYDAIYVGRLISIKRHWLAAKVQNLALVSGSLHGRTKISDIPDHCYLNATPLDPPDVCKKINESACGLILSEKEGACFASSEYLLCGVPVVSTTSEGGRAVWYNNYNSIICDPTPDAVEQAVHEFVKNPRDPWVIRSMHIEQAEDYRSLFVNLLAEVFCRFGVKDIDATKFFRDQFFHKMRTSHRPDFQKLFPPRLS